MTLYPTFIGKNIFKIIIYSILVLIFFFFSCDNEDEKEKTTFGACIYNITLFPGYSYCTNPDTKEICEDADGGATRTEFFLDQSCYKLGYKYLCGNSIYKKEKCNED